MREWPPCETHQRNLYRCALPVPLPLPLPLPLPPPTQLQSRSHANAPPPALHPCLQDGLRPAAQRTRSGCPTAADAQGAGVAAPEKTAETKTAAPRVQASPVIVTQAKVNCTDRAFGQFGVCVACGGVQGLHIGRRSRL